MQVIFKVNLGTMDIAAIKDKTGVQLDIEKCRTAHPDKPTESVDIPNAAAEWLIERNLVEPVKVRGVAKQSEVTAPAK